PFINRRAEETVPLPNDAVVARHLGADDDGRASIHFPVARLDAALLELGAAVQDGVRTEIGAGATRTNDRMWIGELDAERQRSPLRITNHLLAHGVAAALRLDVLILSQKPSSHFPFEAASVFDAGVWSGRVEICGIRL